MVAPITASSSGAASGAKDCTVGEHWGCVDAHWSNTGLFATAVGNFDDLTLRGCADKCAELNFKVNPTFLSHFILRTYRSTNDHFAKTGSGQM